jgi:hypothetical protein
MRGEDTKEEEGHYRYFSNFSMTRSCFAKRVTKTALAPPVQLFVKLKQKKMTSLVK